jgi:hypothetical protein
MPSRAQTVTALKARYQKRRVRIPSGSQIRWGQSRRPVKLEQAVEGKVTGWEAWENQASGRISKVLVVQVKGEFLRVHASLVELLPEPPAPPERFPGRRRPSDLAERLV